MPLPGELALTVAVNVTGCPYTVGSTDETIAVVVPLWLTVCEYAAEVLVMKSVSPL